MYVTVPVFFLCTHATQQRCITHDLHWPTRTDGTSDILWPMALFIWHNTQTLASSPISPPAVTLWSDHTNPLLQLHVLSPVTQEDQFISDGVCMYSLKIRVLNDWLRLAALIFWSTDTSAFFLGWGIDAAFCCNPFPLPMTQCNVEFYKHTISATSAQNSTIFYLIFSPLALMLPKAVHYYYWPPQ